MFRVAKIDFDDSDWRTLSLPHDWAVELPFVHDDAGTGDEQLRSHGYKPLGRRYPETSAGWYRRKFNIPAGDAGRRTAGVAQLALSSVVLNTSAKPCNASVGWSITDASGAVAAIARSAVQIIPAGGSAAFLAAANLNKPDVWTVETPHLYAARVSVECDGIVNDVERIDFGVRSAVFDPDRGFFLNGEPLKLPGV